MLKIIFMGTPEFSVPILNALHQNYEVVAVVGREGQVRLGRKDHVPEGYQDSLSGTGLSV